MPVLALDQRRDLDAAEERVGEGVVDPRELALRGEERNIDAISNWTTSMLVGRGTAHMELAVTLSNCTGPAGVTIAASPGGEEYTHIYYDPSNYTVNVDRSQSSSIDEFANYTMIGYFYPYTFSNGTTESLHMNVFVDGSLVEVYINVS